MQEKGSLKQIMVAYTAQTQVCPDASGKALNWGACFTAFGVLAFGVIIALGFFIVEFLAGSLGLKIPILAWYGVGNMPEVPVAYEDYRKILAIKDAEIKIMKEKLQNLEQNKKHGMDWIVD